MPSPTTRDQLAELSIATDRALIICDVDEVVVHFLRALEDYLDGQGLWLDAASFALNGNIRTKAGNDPITGPQLSRHLIDFFSEYTIRMAPIDGAAQALARLSQDAQIVMLTNLPDRFRRDRVENLNKHGMGYPVITNSGPKGPAIKALAEAVTAPVIFIDDSPSYIASAAEYCQRAHLVHFMQDERFSALVPAVPQAGLRTDNWRDAAAHMAGLIADTQG